MNRCRPDRVGCTIVETLLEGGSFFESPRWHDGRWWTSDIGGDDGRTLLMCVAPDFLEHNRVGATDARLVTTTVDVPRAGLP
jgi:hypothetical protein